MRRALKGHKPRHFPLVGALAAGVAVADSAVVREVIPIGGHFRARVRAKLSAEAGTLKFYFKRPQADGSFSDDDSLRHATQNPTDLALANTSEAYREIELWGEEFLELEYTDDGGGGGSTIDYIAVSLL